MEEEKRSRIPFYWLVQPEVRRWLDDQVKHDPHGRSLGRWLNDYFTEVMNDAEG